MGGMGQPGDVGATAVILPGVDGTVDGVFLNRDLVERVFRFLPILDLMRASLVSRDWKEVSGDREFWRVIDVAEKEVPLLPLLQRLQRFPLQPVEVLRLGAVGTGDARALIECPLTSLTELVIDSLTDPHTTLATAEASFPALRKLTIRSADFRHKPSQSLVVTHQQLTHLVVVHARNPGPPPYGDKLTLRCPALVHLALHAMVHTRLEIHTPELRELLLPDHKLASGNQLRGIIATLPKLEKLDLSHSTVNTNETLRDLDLVCPNVAELIIAKSPNVTLDGVVFMNLRRLDASGCSSNLCQTAIRALGELEELVLDDSGLQALDLTTSRQLRVVSLNRSRITSLRLSSPKLTEVRLAGCQVLGTLDIRSSAAKCFEWSHLTALTTVKLNCANLEHLALEDCDALKPTEIAALSGKGLPKLRRLSLQGCEGFDTMTVTSDSLEEIDAGRCRLLHTAHLSCERLVKLQLSDCGSLQELSLKSEAFESINLGICTRLERLTLTAPSLKSLNLTGCGSLRSAALVCPKLKDLACTFCLELEQAFFEQLPKVAPELATLSLASCSGLQPSYLAPLKRMYQLTSLDLSLTYIAAEHLAAAVCPNPKGGTPMHSRQTITNNADLAMPGLRTLHLSTCQFVDDAAARPLTDPAVLPSLENLDMTRVPLSPDVLRGVVAARREKLRFLNLTGCSGVNGDLSSMLLGSSEDFAAILPRLESLKCERCPSLTSFEVIAPTPSSTPPFASLTHISLRMCRALKSLRLDHGLPSLLHLDLAWCDAMQEISMKGCTNTLQTLVLTGCTGLDPEKLDSELTSAADLQSLVVNDAPRLAEVGRVRWQNRPTRLRRS